MKRSSLKRTAGPKRTDALKRTSLKRIVKLPDRSPEAREAARAARLWWEKVTGKGKGACAVCGSHRRLEAHHVLGQGVLKARFPNGAVRRLHESPVDGGIRLMPTPRGEEPDVTLDEILWDPRNGLCLDHRCHEAHTGAFRRIPLSALTDANRRFAAEVRMIYRLEREYDGDA